MSFFVTFLEGVTAFISPCTLPLLPLYISYLTGGDRQNKRTAVLRSLGFVLGFGIVYTLMGVFAGAIGKLLSAYSTALNIVCGAVIILFGLSYLDVIHLNFLKGMKKKPNVNSFFSAVLFGIVYSVSLTPCVGAFLGSALMLAARSDTALRGAALLGVYSLGMGVPFVLSAALIDYLKGAFDWIKKHYGVINRVCGALLIVLGILMATGLLGRLMAVFS